jgi:uncharacterized RDD family membrane protein YckC
MSDNSLEDTLLNLSYDPLQRPLPAHLVPNMPSAGDVMLATFWQRCTAFLVDMAFIFFLCCCVLWICNHYGVAINVAQGVVFFCVIWATYVTLFSISRWHATLGQLMVGIHLYSLFNNKIGWLAALVRFLLMAAPSMTILYVIVVFVFPEMFVALELADNTTVFMVLTIASLAQLTMLWPLFSGHYRQILWDSSLRCCVVKKRIV